jgi:hypothetical protein
VGGQDSDRISGQFGNELLHGCDSPDYMYGGDGMDDMFGYGGDEFLRGGVDEDDIWWSSGDDVDHGSGTASTFLSETGPMAGYIGTTAELRFMNYAVTVLWGGLARC